MHRNLMLTYLDVTNSKTQFFPHQNPAETKHRRHDWEWFCEQLRLNGHHIARRLTVQQAARASAGGPVCLDCYECSLLLVVATVSRLMPNPASSSPFSSKCKQSHFWYVLPLCAPCKSCLVYSISLQSSVHLSREEMFFISHWDWIL